MSFWRLIVRNIQRNGAKSLLATIGVVLGVAVWLFFAGLSHGIQQNVLGKIVSDHYVEIVPKTVKLGGLQRRGGLFGGKGSGLNTYTVQDLLDIEGVVAAYPKQQMSFPGTIHGGKALMGEDAWSELVADGIESQMVDEDSDAPELAFKDWVAVDGCTQDVDCGEGASCQHEHCVHTPCTPDDEIWWTNSHAAAATAMQRARATIPGARNLAIRPYHNAEGTPRWAVTVRGSARRSWRNTMAKQRLAGARPTDTLCPGQSYCDGALRACEMPVPILLSPSLLQLYNGSVHSVLRGTDAKMIPPRLSKKALIGFTVRARLGEGMLGTSMHVQDGTQAVRDVPMRLVGFSPLAIPIGVTVPRGYIQRWNAQYGTKKSADEYSSIVVELDKASSLNSVVSVVENDLNLEIAPQYKARQKAAGMLGILLLVFGLLAAVIVLVGAMHIAQTSALRNQARRREFGVMRSIGASSRDIVAMLLAEAALLGGVAGTIAFPIAWAAGQLANWAFVHYAPSFPFKPDTLLVFEPWWWAVSIGVAVLASMLGAWLPAMRIARMDPAAALRTHAAK